MLVPKGILLVQGGRADMLIIGYVNGDIWHMCFGRQGGGCDQEHIQARFDYFSNRNYQ